MAVMQQSEYTIFYDRDASIELSLLSYSCQCFTTKTSAWDHMDNTLRP